MKIEDQFFLYNKNTLINILTLLRRSKYYFELRSLKFTEKKYLMLTTKSLAERKSIIYLN